MADGVFMSKLVSLISLWGGCEKYLMRSLQIVQNKAARVVTRLDWDTPTMVLLSQCGWLSVQQLQSWCTMFRPGQPKYLHNFFNLEYKVKTRLADHQLLKPTQAETSSHELLISSFRWRAMQQWNDLPFKIRNLNPIEFKKHVKMWIKENIPIG